MVGSAPYEVGSPACTNYGMQPSSRYSGLCSSYGTPTASGYSNNPQNNYIGQNTYTFKTETFNAPTYQLHDSSGKPTYNTQQPQPQQQQPQQQQQQVQMPSLQAAFKPFVQSVVQPVANNFINMDYSFKSVFDRFKDVLKLQHVGLPQQQQQQQQQQSYQTNYQPYQQTGYVQQQPTAYAQQPTTYTQPQQQQPSYQQSFQQTYQLPTGNGQQSNYQQTYSSYTQSKSVPEQSTAQNNRNSPFLTYDWSQLFNNNNNNNNNYNYQTK